MNENLTLQGHTLDNVPLSWYRVVTQHTVKGLKQCSLTQSLLQWKIPSATTAPHTQVSCYLCEDSPSDMTTPCYSKMHISKMTNYKTCLLILYAPVYVECKLAYMTSSFVDMAFSNSLIIQ